MSRRPDLFGETRGPSPRKGDVELLLAVLDERPRAWLVRLKSRVGEEARWIPKAECRRMAAPDDDVFQVPRWIAADRGWL